MRLLLISCLAFIVSMAQTECTTSSECGDGFCNFDDTTSGTCESCTDFVTTCSRAGFDTSEGEAECIAVCEPDSCINVNQFRANPGYYTCDCVASDNTCWDGNPNSCEKEANCPAQDEEYRADPIPDGDCPCIGLPDDIDPADGYGGFCYFFDQAQVSPFYDTCTSEGADWCGSENWCVLKWCYVDINDGDCNDYQESSMFPGNYYSYGDACGTPDCYTCSFDSDVDCPEACPVIPENLNCDCPAACRPTWIGDGTCDERDQGTSCELCNFFWDSGEAGSGIFDGGDCDIEITTTDPNAIDHNDIVIVGDAQCVHSEGICGSVSFIADQTAVEDPDDDGNNYGCLTSVGTKAWFIFRMDSPGQFQADMLSDDPVDFVIWGPYADVETALGDCGTLTSVSIKQCSFGEVTTTHTLEIENTLTDEVYILMISDNNLTPTLTTINATSSTAVLDCDVTASDGYACVSESSILIDFNDTEVARHNLANKWAESQGIDDEPLGIYYKNVGFYGTEQLALLVTTSTPDQYECNSLHPDGNKCADVLNGDFGQINMESGDVTLKLQFVKDDGSDDGVPLEDGESFPRLKLTVFDLDSGFPEGEGLEIVKPMYVCPGGVVTDNSSPPYLDEARARNILHFSDNDFTTSNGFRWDVNSGCYESRSDPPTGTFVVKQIVGCQDELGGGVKCRENNPEGVNQLGALQQSMSVEAEFQDVTSDGIELIVHISREHSKSRNVWFAGQSDSIGRTCCADVFDQFVCLYGYINDNMECGVSSTAGGLCSPEFCCEPEPSSHGDPIIHTYHGDCYDLHQDGNWLASAHPAHDHEVHIAVYNEYMRQISVTNRNGDVMLAINNYGEILNNGFPYSIEKNVVPCPEDYHLKDCIGEYISISFDAQDLYFDVHALLRHDYNDNALREGEAGFHMDIYPQPYIRKFNARLDEYTGLYFHNPLPEELLSCEQREHF